MNGTEQTDTNNMEQPSFEYKEFSCDFLDSTIMEGNTYPLLKS